MAGSKSELSLSEVSLGGFPAGHNVGHNAGEACGEVLEVACEVHFPPTIFTRSYH